jgi:hypothetical protein
VSVAEAVASGDVRRALEAIRDDLAVALDAADVNMKPQIAGQLRAVLADLRALPSAPVAQPDGVVTIDDAKAKRAARQQSAAAAASAPAAGGGKRRG